jgi:hypothetical protein
MSKAGLMLAKSHKSSKMLGNGKSLDLGGQRSFLSDLAAGLHPFQIPFPQPLAKLNDYRARFIPLISPDRVHFFSISTTSTLPSLPYSDDPTGLNPNSPDSSPLGRVHF